jgi:high-affinity nickel-transport protein
MGCVILFNFAIWVFSLRAFHAHPVLLGAAALAYTLGLRHAVDADHIASIDNVTRKLMQDGKKPVSVGLFFSLGHSSVVVLAFVVLAMASGDDGLFWFKPAASIIGAAVSAMFLFAIALVNGFSLLGTWRAFRRVRTGGTYEADDLDLLYTGGGLLGRMFRPAFTLIEQSWHMYPLGVLFGLGFDTATEIAVLGLSATGVAQGLSLWSLLALPALFTAGMTLVDTADSILMLGAYGWAFVRPIRKLYYNLTITLVSVVIAVVIGGLEALGLVGQAFKLAGAPWRVIARLNDGFGTLGYLILGIFTAAWIGSVLAYRLLGYDRFETGAGSAS